VLMSNFREALKPPAADGNSFGEAMSFRLGGVTLVPTTVSFLQEPTAVEMGVNFSPTITAQILDQFGNLFDSGADVVLSIASGTGTLNGVLTVAAVNGLATFSNINISAGNGAFTLSVASAGLAGDTSSSFDVSRYWLKTTGLNYGIMVIGTSNFNASIQAYIPTNAASFKNLFTYSGTSYHFRVYDADHATKPNDVTITMSDGVELTWAGAFSESRSVSHTFRFARISPTAIQLWIDGVSKGTVATTSLIQWRFRHSFYTTSANTVYGNVVINALGWLCDDGSGTSCAETGGGAAATFAGAGGTWVYGPTPESAV